MLNIEKTVFISYRRTNSFMARAILQDLTTHGYDTFLDVESIYSGAWEQNIEMQIKRRGHFVLVLTPDTLERCTNPDDVLRKEIELAIEHQRNVIPLMFDSFEWRDQGAYLASDTLKLLPKYNALRVYSEYFNEALERLRTRFLNVPVDVVIHPS